MAEDLVKTLLDEISKIKSEKKPIIRKNFKEEELFSFLKEQINEDALSTESYKKLLLFYANNTVRTDLPQFFNQLWSGFSEASLHAEIINQHFNSSSYTFEVAPMATIMEKIISEKIQKLIAYKEGSTGIFNPGGSFCNFQAMLVARNIFLENSKAEGLFGNKAIVAYVSDQAHYSYQKAVNLIGIGENNLIKVKSNELAQMDPNELEKEIKKTIAEGKTPFFLGLTAGTTVCGAFDSIHKTQPLAKQYKLYTHVDGALGGSVLFSDKHQELLAGIEQSDSFSFNFHKMLGVSLQASLLIFNGDRKIQENCHVEKSSSDYLFHDKDSEYDLGKNSLQCGRKADSLKAFLEWSQVGSSGFEKRIDHFFNLAKYTEEKVKKHPQLNLLCPVQSTNICFQFFREENENTESKNKLNFEIRKRLVEDGNFLVNKAFVGDELCIRLIILNKETQEHHIDDLFQKLEEIYLQVKETKQ